MFKCQSLFILTAICLLVVSDIKAQYFGRNKPRYNDLEFGVEKTPRFDIYNYVEDKGTLYRFATWAEQWADQHERVLNNQLPPNNPIILYNNHAHFQQTNTISGNISVGTGGVTEAFKNRVILPFTFTNEQTHHVLGHELVHAYQYNLVINGDSTNLRNLSNLPLWMVEGMAEYLSIGSYDPFTAMWMRDAVLNDDVPNFKKLNDSKYFPYRYGQAFWAFISAKYGDAAIEPIFMATAKYGFDVTVKGLLNKTQKELGEEFVQYLKDYYTPFLRNKKEDKVGKEILSDKNAGQMNVSPVVSPNGKYLVFLSEKSVFSTELYLANTQDGKIQRKLASSSAGGHIEEFNYIESSGSWSPNSKQFAFVVFSKGRNELVIKNVENGKTVRSKYFKEVPAISNPAWNPDGKTIVFCGLVEGQVDLFSYDIDKDKLQRLTDDIYSETQPAWSADGKTLVYATDQLTFGDGKRLRKWTFNIATRDMETGQSKIYDIFTGADNLNPQMDDEGNIYFLSNRDGYRNIYKYKVGVDSLFQMSHFLTGVTGITAYSPALSVSYKKDRMVYSYYRDHEYKIFSARPDAMELTPVDRFDINQEAGTLPYNKSPEKVMINSRIDRLSEHYPQRTLTFKEEGYRSKLKLDMLTGGTGIGVGTNQAYGTRTGLAGGIFALFSDMLGEQQIYTNVALSGQIYDFGGQVFYMNNKSRLGWGIGVSHIPAYYSGLTGIQQVNLQNQAGQIIPALKYDIALVRRFEEGINTLVQLPFNVTHRVEVGGGYSRYHFRNTLIEEYYYYNPDNPFDVYNGTLIQSTENKQQNDIPGFNLFNVNGAFVGDNSQWGIASPMNGFRYRIGAEQYFGYYKFLAGLADLRAYKFLKPINLSARLYHYSRFGRSVEDNELYPLFAIDPTIVRGFLKYSEQEFTELMGISYPSTYGSKLLAANFEIRLPFTGPERLSLIKSNFLLTELALFFDSGVAFNQYDQLTTDNEIFKVPILMSTGISLRLNLFGSIVLEPYYAKTLNKGGRWNFGFNLIPGW